MSSTCAPASTSAPALVATRASLVRHADRRSPGPASSVENSSRCRGVRSRRSNITRVSGRSRIHATRCQQRIVDEQRLRPDGDRVDFGALAVHARVGLGTGQRPCAPAPRATMPSRLSAALIVTSGRPLRDVGEERPVQCRAALGHHADLDLDAMVAQMLRVPAR